MIEFQTTKDANGKIIQFTVRGHSDFACEGEDIVCASVSSAVWLTLNGIEKQNLAKLSYEQSDGFVDCKIPQQRNASADAMLNSLIYFMDELSTQYKKYIKVSHKCDIS